MLFYVYLFVPYVHHFSYLIYSNKICYRGRWIFPFPTSVIAFTSSILSYSSSPSINQLERRYSATYWSLIRELGHPYKQIGCVSLSSSPRTGIIVLLYRLLDWGSALTLNILSIGEALALLVVMITGLSFETLDSEMKCQFEARFDGSNIWQLFRCWNLVRIVAMNVSWVHRIQAPWGKSWGSLRPAVNYSLANNRILNRGSDVTYCAHVPAGHTV